VEPLVPLTAHGAFGAKPAPAPSTAAPAASDVRPPFKISTNPGAAALAPLPLTVALEGAALEGVSMSMSLSHGSASIVDDSAALSLASSVIAPAVGTSGDSAAGAGSERRRPPPTAQEQALLRARREYQKTLAHAALLEKHKHNQRVAADR